MQGQLTRSLPLSNRSCTLRHPLPTLCLSTVRGSLRPALPPPTLFLPRRRKRRKRIQRIPNLRKSNNKTEPVTESSLPSSHHLPPPRSRLPLFRPPRPPRRCYPPHQRHRRSRTSVDPHRHLPLRVQAIRSPGRPVSGRREIALSARSSTCSPPKRIRSTRGESLIVNRLLSLWTEHHTHCVSSLHP